MDANRLKHPSAWEPDIEQSVAEYGAWYREHSPKMFANARDRAVIAVEEAMRLTEDFRAFDADALLARPSMLFVARMCVAPPMARERFVGFARAKESLVEAMETKGVIPARTKAPRAQLEAMAGFLRPLLDPLLFVWVHDGRDPTDLERDRALLVVGERLATALYLPEHRNAQEARQKQRMRSYLASNGFEESPAPAWELPPGTFGFGRTVEGRRQGGNPQKLPIDCVVAPPDKTLPLALVEMKSAGDFTNVNKRRKEESDKHASLKRAHGEKIAFLLQLFGYFDDRYLDFESSAGIDWAWDHRLSDLAGYFGIG